MREPAEATISAPMVLTGIRTSIPWRIPQLSAIQPMNGRISSPGRIHSENIENPMDRARGGMAIDITVNIPGARIAPQMLMGTMNATATARFGARA